MVRIFCILSFLAVQLLGVFPVGVYPVGVYPASAAQQAGPVLQARLSASVSGARAGQGIAYTLTLEPGQGQAVEIESIHLADASSWSPGGLPGVPFSIQGQRALQLTLTPAASGKARPVLLISYRAAGGPGTLLVEGDWVDIQPAGWWRWGEINWMQIFSFLAGALVSLFTTVFVEMIKDWKQAQVNRERVHSLLNFACYQADYATDYGQLVPLEQIQSIYDTEGLYTALRHEKLEQDTRVLWLAASRHNQSVEQRQGSQASGDLKRCAIALEARLQRLDGGTAGRAVKTRGGLRKALAARFQSSARR